MKKDRALYKKISFIPENNDNLAATWRSMSFKQLNLHQKLLETLEKRGLSIPTPIQEQAIPIILEGKDLRASAQTGTGKTAAFLLPAIQRLIEKARPGKGPRVLILSPTRELAAQIASEVVKFTSGFPEIRSVCIFGGTPYHMQNRQLSRPHDILVATPGRLIDQLERKQVDLQRVEILILDEADRMLDMGFIDPVIHIASHTPTTRQTLLFSATLKGPVLKLSEKLMKNPVSIEIAAPPREQPQITEHFHAVDNIHHKHLLLNEILNSPGMNQAIVFTATKRAAEELADKLAQEGYESTALHGDMRQRQRDRTLKMLRFGKVRILVATDVAARGIDILAITHVINFDLPMSAEDYVHRIGRTGRAGATGLAFSFATKRDVSILKEIEKLTGQTIPLFKDLASQSNHQRPGQKRFPKRSSFFQKKGQRPRRAYSSSN